MFDWLSRVTIACFGLSYLICLALEVSRLFFRVPIRLFILIGLTAVGLLTHTLYLSLRGRDELARSITLFSSWQDWCLLASWVLAAVYLVLSVRRPKMAIGVFMLPLILAFIGAAYLVRNVEPFPRDTASTYWGVMHGAALLAGTVAVMLGFVAGLMYLLQSYRLKQKLTPGRALALPSLEWLQRTSEWALVISSLLVAVGLLSGIVLNLLGSGTSTVGWTDLEVWTSGVLFLWLVVALTFNFFYKPARRGRKVAYLVVASFVFLAMELGIVLYAGHAATKPSETNTASVTHGGER